METIKKILKILFPFVLGLGILWWMYRGTDWSEFWQRVTQEMKWEWMLFSLVFGVTAQTFRARRWKLALEPVGEHPRLRTCVDSIFISYAASLVVPRVGEVARCGMLKRKDGTSFTKSLGTVVTERVVDSLLIMLITAFALAMQLPTFLKFLHTSGTSVHGILARFTQTGYLVTFLCIIAIVVTLLVLIGRYAAFKKGKDILLDLKSGVLSLRHVRSLPLYLFYSVGIWVSYFLHFYIAFFCFDFTAHFSPFTVLLIFCVGSFAVLVPTPNGAGPWHFAVKTMLVIYGVAEIPAVMFALIVHTIQTFLVVILGVIGWMDLSFIPTRKKTAEAEKNETTTIKGCSKN